jgi:ribosome-associated protein
MQELRLKEEPTPLNKLLKFSNLVQSGGEAKVVIGEGLVKVNGEVETRIRRKIHSGDVIEFGGESVTVTM